MTHRKIIWTLLLMGYVVTAVFCYFLGSSVRIGGDSGILSQKPLGEGGILVIAIATDDISVSLNHQIDKGDLPTPPIKLQHIGSSYKTADSWIAVGKDLIIAYIYRDVAAILTKDELRATILHDICHINLKHTESRILEQEIEADICAYNYGMSADVIISAINKLSLDKNEKLKRIESLRQLI